MRKVIFTAFTMLFVLSVSAQETAEQKNAKRRMFIDDFLATYEAAYEKKEIEYIEVFFSTDALIITETKQLNKCGEELIPKTTKKRPYATIVEDKKQYIKRLREIFNKNVKIKLNIAGIRVTQHSLHPEIYGVSFSQMWLDQQNGNNIEDKMPGYIFLMIDFKRNETQPTIHVRTWQPKDNIKSPKDKYNLMDFRIYDYGI